jgi:alternate signal-mediated exported protein
MKKSTKGALAVGAAAVLLLGTASTIAYWTDETTADAGEITSGEISLSAVECDAAWTYAEGDTTAAVDAIVPGDTVVKACTGTLTLAGNHIGATVTATETGLPAGPLADELVVDGSMTSPAATISDPGTYDVTIQISVEFPFGTVADNAAQLQTAALDTITVSAVQTHP